jgi:hypothetical protein
MIVAASIVMSGVVFVGNTTAAEVQHGTKREAVEAIDVQRRTIYHSPQTPGYTCWTYATVMPDRSILLSFFQATGPKDGRPRAPVEVRKKLGMDWQNTSDPLRDMTGLKTCNVYLRSADNGKTWKTVSEDRFQTCYNSLVYGMAVTRHNSVLRAVHGSYLPYDVGVPGTGLWQRSVDGGKTWGKLDSFLPPNRFMVWPVGIRQLRDGRMITLGGVAKKPSDQGTWSDYGAILEPLLLVFDDNGRSWGQPIQVIPDEYRNGWSCDECDAAELANGDLFWVFRRSVPEDADKPWNQRRHTYWQGVTEKCGDTWKPKWVGPSPFPNLGLPNLLATRQGPILLVNAGQWTADAGKTWHPVRNYPGTMSGAQAYYPKGLQLPDGRILVFAHVGSDDPYGAVDQSIVMDSFRLKAK